MKRRVLVALLTLALSGGMLIMTGCQSEDTGLVLQDLDYTEDPVDVPNPDRGFYRANDGMVVPVTATEKSRSQKLEVGEEPTEVAGVTIETRVSHLYFDLKNYSDNSVLSEGDTPYSEDFFAPKDVSIRSRGDKAPYDYNTHYDYWMDKVAPTLPHGTSQPITDDGLDYIRGVLDQVRAGNGTVIIRFTYDGMGLSWAEAEHPDDGYMEGPIRDIEPDKEMVLTHIEQVAPILAEYEDVIMAVDGGFFGPWGEMHSTSYGTSTEAYAWLLDALLEAVPESRSIIVQPGAFLSWYNAAHDTDYTFANMDEIPAPEPGTPESRFGFFNDSYSLGTDDEEWIPDDWGSISEGLFWPGNPLGSDEGDFDRARIMHLIRGQNNFYGGEAQGDETAWNTFPFVAWEAAYAQTVYLNADYEEDVHQRWADFEYTEENVTVPMDNAYETDVCGAEAVYDPVYEGKNGLEYWRDRLGYRLVVREAKAPETVTKDGQLTFEGKIQNVGFGNIVNEKKVTVLLVLKEDPTVIYTYDTDLDPRAWRPDPDSRADNEEAWRDMSFTLEMGGDVVPGEYDIYIKINDPKEQSGNKRCIRFANKGDMWNEELGANRIGSVTVTEAE